MCSPSWSPTPPPSPSHLSGSSQCTRPEHPVSCIEPRLVIHFAYDNIHVFVLFSQIIPPSPSHRVQKTVLYICVSFALSHIRLSSPSFYIPYMYIWFSSVAQSCPTLCDPMNCSMPGLPVHHLLPEFTQTHMHWVSEAIQPSHPLSSPSPPAPNHSQHQSLFQWVNSSHEVAKVLEFQL